MSKNLNSILAKVIKGKGLGKKLGFPTINLEIGFLPVDFGVYLCKIIIDSREYKGVMHYGHRKTLDETEISVEIYLLDFKGGNLYNQQAKVEILTRMRDVKKFESLEKLRAQVEKDVKKAKIYFSI